MIKQVFSKLFSKSGVVILAALIALAGSLGAAFINARATQSPQPPKAPEVTAAGDRAAATKEGAAATNGAAAANDGAAATTGGAAAKDGGTAISNPVNSTINIDKKPIERGVALPSEFVRAVIELQKALHHAGKADQTAATPTAGNRPAPNGFLRAIRIAICDVDEVLNTFRYDETYMPVVGATDIGKRIVDGSLQADADEVKEATVKLDKFIALNFTELDRIRAEKQFKLPRLREMSWCPLAHTDDLQSETALDSETASPASLGAEAAEDDDTPGMPDSDPIAPAPEKVPFESEFRDWRTIPPGAPLRSYDEKSESILRTNNVNYEVAERMTISKARSLYHTPLMEHCGFEIRQGYGAKRTIIQDVIVEVVGYRTVPPSVSPAAEVAQNHIAVVELARKHHRIPFPWTFHALWLLNDPKGQDVKDFARSRISLTGDDWSKWFVKIGARDPGIYLYNVKLVVQADDEPKQIIPLFAEPRMCHFGDLAGYEDYQARLNGTPSPTVQSRTARPVVRRRFRP